MTVNLTDILIALVSAIAILAIAWLSSVDLIAETHATGAIIALPVLAAATMSANRSAPGCAGRFA
ncbi:MAG: hypothetical protein R3D89_05395 [Sphingomonadaceae bacterium]